MDEPKREHDYFKGCGSGDCGGTCWKCTLAICKVCGLIEGSLTTECPGIDSYSEHGDAVYEGKEDFVDGRWQQGKVSQASPVFYKGKQ